jgi:hypothetical protein
VSLCSADPLACGEIDVILQSTMDVPPRSHWSVPDSVFKFTV